MRRRIRVASLSVERRFKLFFVIQYLGVGILSPYLALYLSAKGLTGVQLGILLGSMPLVTILAQPLWGILSDLFHVRRPLLALACIVTGMISFSFYWLEGFGLIMPGFLLYSVFLAPIGLLSTSLALDYLEKEGNLVDFGLLRLWGSIGFAVTALVAGSLFITSLVHFLTIIYGAIMIFLSLVALTLPEAPPHGKMHWWDSLSKLRGETSLKIFLLSSMFIGATLGVGMQYLAIYLNILQASGWVIGFAIALQAILEVPLMFYAPRWIARYGLSVVLIGGVILLPLRWLLYIFIDNPLWVIPTQVFHSMTIVSLMVVGVMYVDQQMPKQWRATGQGLYTTIVNGIGPAIGLFGAGIAYQQNGIHSVWLMNTIVASVGVVILLSTFWITSPNRQKSES